MKKAILSRFESTVDGTYGELSSEGFRCFMVERQWLDNARQVSCIPAGIYQCEWRKSPKFGMCYEVMHVPNRGNILIHAGNFWWHSHGCLLPASRLGYMDGHKAGLLSRPALLKLNAFFNHESFLLEIKNAYDIASPSF